MVMQLQQKCENWPGTGSEDAKNCGAGESCAVFCLLHVSSMNLRSNQNIWENTTVIHLKRLQVIEEDILGLENP